MEPASHHAPTLPINSPGYTKMGDTHNSTYNFSKKKEAEIEEAKNGTSPDPVIYDEEFDY